jgi:hypothetical protein
MASTRWRRCSSAPVSASTSAPCVELNRCARAHRRDHFPAAHEVALADGNHRILGVNFLSELAVVPLPKVAVDWVGRSGTVMVVAATREAIRSARVSHQLALLAPCHQPRSWPHVAAESGQPPTTSRSIDVLRSVAGTWWRVSRSSSPPSWRSPSQRLAPRPTRGGGTWRGCQRGPARLVWRARRGCW